MRRRPTALAAVLSVLALALAACSGPAASVPTDTPSPAVPFPALTGTGSPARSGPLVVETVFDQLSLDPQRRLGRTDGILGKALYQTLTTFSPSDPTTPVPGLAQYTISPEGNWLTLRLLAGVTFSDGTPITTDDVIFTLERAQGLHGAAAAALGSVGMTKVDDRVLTITSPDANFALPAILANPAFGILNSRLAKAHGATIGPNDTAAGWLRTHSAGSGPYVLSSAGPGEVRLTVNPHWTGARPAHPSVVLKNASPRQQLADLEAGRADVALDLAPRQAEGIRLDPADGDLTVVTERSMSLAYLMLNQSAKVNRWTADPRVAEAIRRGIDTPALAALAGGGATAAGGLVPAGIDAALPPAQANPTPTPGATATPNSGATATPGASSTPPTPPGPSGSTLPGPTGTAPAPDRTGRNLTAAKAALAGSGYHGQPIPLAYAVDLPIEGVPASRLAEAIRVQLAQVGITMVPTGMPASRLLAESRSGRLPLALLGWTPDYPDPESSLVFAPGHPLGLRAGWSLRDDPQIDTATIEALDSVGADRAAAYTAWQRIMVTQGAFVPLIQPASHYAYGPRVRALATHPVWTLDLARTR